MGLVSVFFVFGFVYFGFGRRRGGEEETGRSRYGIWSWGEDDPFRSLHLGLDAGVGVVLWMVSISAGRARDFVRDTLGVYFAEIMA